MENWENLCDNMSCEELEKVIHYCKKLKEHTVRHSVNVPLNTSDEELQEILDNHSIEYGDVVKITRRKQIGELNVRISFETR